MAGKYQDNPNATPNVGGGNYQGGGNLHFGSGTKGKVTWGTPSQNSSGGGGGGKISDWSAGYVGESGGGENNLSAADQAAAQAAIEAMRSTNMRRQNDEAIAANAFKKQQERRAEQAAKTAAPNPFEIQGADRFLEAVRNAASQARDPEIQASIEEWNNGPSTSGEMADTIQDIPDTQIGANELTDTIPEPPANNESTDYYDMMQGTEVDVPAFEYDQPAIPSNTVKQPDGSFLDTESGEVTDNVIGAANAEADRIIAEADSTPDYNSDRYYSLPDGSFLDLEDKLPIEISEFMESRGLSADEALEAFQAYSSSKTANPYSQYDREDHEDTSGDIDADRTVNAGDVPPSVNAGQKNISSDPDSHTADTSVPPTAPPSPKRPPTPPTPPTPPAQQAYGAGGTRRGVPTSTNTAGSTVRKKPAQGSSNRDYQDRAARRIARIDQNISDIADDLRAGYFITTEDSFDENTGVVTTRSAVATSACDNYLRNARNAAPSERARRIAWMQAQKLGAIGLDRSGHFAKRAGNKEDLEQPEEIITTPEEVARLFEEMTYNIKKFGTPYHMSRGEVVKVQGKARYCIPIPTMEEFQILSSKGGCWEGMAYEDVVQQGVDEWNNFIHPRLLASEDGPTIIAIENMMRATVSMCNGAITYEDVHVLPSDAMHLKEIEDRAIRLANTNGSGDLAKAAATAQKKREEALQQLNRWNGHAITTRNPDGSIDIDEFYNGRPENAFTSFVRMFLSGVRVASTIDPLLMGSSVAEKAQGSAIYKGWRTWQWSRRFGDGKFADQYRPTEATFNTARYNQKAMSSLEAYTYLNDVAGYDFVMAFTSTGELPTEENVQKFAQEYLRGNPQKKTNKLVQLANKGMQFSAKAWGGDWVLRGSDMTNFIDIFMINQVTRFRRYGTPPMFTREQLEQAFRLDPVATIQAMMSTFDGMQAFYTMRKRTLAGSTVFTEAIKEWFRRHPAFDLLFVTTTGQKFLNFNLKAIRQWIPMMNTFELFVMKRRAGKLSEDLSDMRFAELLTSTEYKNALRMDFTYMLNNAMKIGMWMLLISLHGLQPPDDEDKMGQWDEYRIGPTQENSVPIRLPWYFDDLTTWTLPVAMAIYGTAFGFGGKHLTFKQANDLIMDGSSDMIGGMITGGLQGLLENFDVDLINAQKANDDPDAPQATAIDNLDALQQRLAIVGTDMFADLISPRWINDLINYGIIPSEDNIAHSSSKVYTRNPNDDPMATEYLDSNAAEMQKIAHDHPIFGLLWNMWDVITGEANNPDRQWTGHLASQMPARTVTDPIGLTWYTEYAVDGHRDENGVFIRAEDDESLHQKCSSLIDLLEKYPDPAQLKAIDLCLPYEIRYYTKLELEAKRDAVWQGYYDTLATPHPFGPSWLSREAYQEAKNDLYNKTKEEADKWDHLIDVLWSHDIPYSPYKMVSLATDYQQIIRDANGNIISEPEALMRQLFGEEVTKEFRNYGNLKTAIPIPWIVGHRQQAEGAEGRTFDDQSPASWFDAGISMDQLKEIYQDKFVPVGSFAGENCFDLLTADGKIFTAVEGGGISGDVPLFGDRGYVPYTDVYPFDDTMKDDDKYADGKKDDEETTTDGKSLTNDNSGWGWTKYPSYKYFNRSSYSRSGYSRGSGGGGYNPKIYSNSRSVSADRATTMRANRPYSKTGRTYLNPNFETKGSREAYKRGDF